MEDQTGKDAAREYGPLEKWRPRGLAIRFADLFTAA